MLTLVFVAAPALAGDTPRERKLYADAADAYDAGDFATAARLLEELIALRPHPALHRNLGRTYEQKPDHRRAIDHYQQYLAASPEAPDRKEIEKRVVDLELEESAAAATSAEVAGPMTDPIDRDKEDPLVRALAERARARGRERAVEERETDGEETEPGRPWQTAGWILAGGAGASLIAGLVFNRLAAGAKNDLEESAAGAYPPTEEYAEEHLDLEDRFDRDRKISYVFLGLGAASGALAVVGFLVDRPPSTDADTEVAVAPGGFRVSTGWKF